MRECRRVFSRRSLLWLLVLMAAVYAVVSGMIRRQLTEEKEA